MKENTLTFFWIFFGFFLVVGFGGGDVARAALGDSCGTGTCVLDSCGCIQESTFSCGSGQKCCLEFENLAENAPTECVTTPQPPDTSQFCAPGQTCRVSCESDELEITGSSCIAGIGDSGGVCCRSNPNITDPNPNDPTDPNIPTPPTTPTQPTTPTDPSGTTLPTLVCDSRTTQVGNVCVPINTGLSERTVSEIVVGFMMFLLGIFGILAVIAFVLAGFMYLTSAGDEGRATKAKTYMLWAIVGVIVGMAGLIILNVIRNLLEGSDTL